MADDHAIVRKGFHALLEQAEHIRIVAECDTTQGARDALLALAPDLLVLDISLPGGGLELLRQMQAMPGTPPVLILSMHVGEPYVSEALRLGAAGYVSKSTAADELLPAIEQLEAGLRNPGLSPNQEAQLRARLKQFRAEAIAQGLPVPKRDTP